MIKWEMCQSIYRWVQDYVPKIEKRTKPYIKNVKDSWRIDYPPAIKFKKNLFNVIPLSGIFLQHNKYVTPLYYMCIWSQFMTLSISLLM